MRILLVEDELDLDAALEDTLNQLINMKYF